MRYKYNLLYIPIINTHKEKYQVTVVFKELAQVFQSIDLEDFDRNIILLEPNSEVEHRLIDKYYHSVVSEVWYHITEKHSLVFYPDCSC